MAAGRGERIMSNGSGDPASAASRLAGGLRRTTFDTDQCRRLGSLILGMLCLALVPAAGAKNGVRPLFQSDAPLAVTLQAPWSELLRDTRDTRRHPAVLTYTDAAGQQQRIEATVETRGLTRLRVCRFPPLRLRFVRAATAGTLFAGQRSLKMVTHCRSGKQFEQYYVQEMLAYRIYNLVTEHSFRVRSLEVAYLEAQGGKPDGPHFAFLIEGVGDMARRNGHKQARDAHFAPSDFDPIALTRFSLFQYLIGNTDFEVLSGPKQNACCHNVRVTAGASARNRIAVPYDFDSSGMVGASYAAPHERLPIKDVSERLFRGFCEHNDALDAVRDEFIVLRPAIFALIQGEPRLNAQRQRATARYFEEFYATLTGATRYTRELSRKCRK